MRWPIKKICEVLERGGLAVLPTDTIYGVVASALNPQALAKLRRAKQRAAGKPFIVLIGSRRELAKLGIKLTAAERHALRGLWPGPNSVIVRGQAFRLPAPLPLRRLLRAAGPVAAPSANPEGAPPAKTISEARAYFGDQVALYVDGGRLDGRASKLLELAPDGQIKIIRV